MACKHEGGMDPCERDTGRHCKAGRRDYMRAYYKGYRKEAIKISERYRRKYVSNCGSMEGQENKQYLGRITAACELLVRADLSRRGFEVTVPVSPTATHDLHVELPSVGWKGVQVKAGIFNTKTGVLRPANSKPCKSPIFVVVHLPTNRIDYREGTEPVPKELKE